MCLGGRLKKNKPLKTGKWKWWLCVAVHWLHHRRAALGEGEDCVCTARGAGISILQMSTDVERGWVDVRRCGRSQTKLPSQDWVPLNLCWAVAHVRELTNNGMCCKDEQDMGTGRLMVGVPVALRLENIPALFWFVYCRVFDHAQGVSVRDVFMVLWFR